MSKKMLKYLTNGLRGCRMANFNTMLHGSLDEIQDELEHIGLSDFSQVSAAITNLCSKIKAMQVSRAVCLPKEILMNSGDDEEHF